MDVSTPARIFLSHKSVDKTVVRDFKLTLEMVGLSPWLDEDDMPAGAELHRALQKGIKDSCAAVFFVTPSYVDDKFLRIEINYAITEKTERGDGFSIVTLVLSGTDGQVGKVPELLEPYVWKQPASHLQGLREILRALPAPFRDIRPSAIITAEPRARVVVTAAQLVSMGPSARPSSSQEVVMVKLENHGERPLYVGGGVSFERDDDDKFFWVGMDATGAQLYKRTVAPGDAYTVTIPSTTLDEHRLHLTRFFFSDEIGRRFWSDKEVTQKALRDE
jgi:TIR domain